MPLSHLHTNVKRQSSSHPPLPKKADPLKSRCFVHNCILVSLHVRCSSHQECTSETNVLIVLTYWASVCVPKCCWTGPELLSDEIKSELCSRSTPSTPTVDGCSLFRARVELVQINHPEIIIISLNSALMIS